ncbi:uncharacterized protein A1O5_01142 [Cladophialophora psammophila CBS 110553]|uniref:Uncharacterized protein n=1 Tax=Cladophialophora psammophila CBS 110553 TaxID=1182543 RepID=W9Y2D6_9EURO|nr:uncharacterized protein A1O5_01142 [Cladophialophora psammophila CBS 110553]EXJ76634.1 hypothetical protein A1O5_01142 [Cladophialophora psammophila CBS 110553]
MSPPGTSTSSQHSSADTLLKALLHGNSDDVRRHLKASGGVNVELDGCGYTGTALHYEASYGTKEMVSVLLEHGADINFLSKDNKSAIDLNCEAGQWDNFDLLCREPDARVRRSRDLIPYEDENPHLVVSASLSNQENRAERVIAYTYSARDFTYERDKIIASAGIEDKMGKLLNDICFMGIWKKDMVRSLIWHIRNPLRNRPVGFAVPTWSWYAVCSPLLSGFWDAFNDNPDQLPEALISESFDTEAQVLEVNMEPESTQGHSHIKGAIKMRGTIVKAFMSSDRGYSSHGAKEQGQS